MANAQYPTFALRHKEGILFFFVVGIFICFALQSAVTLLIGSLLLILFNVIYFKPKPKDVFWVALIFFPCLPPIVAMHHGFSPLYYFIVFLLSLAAAKSIAQFDIDEIQAALGRAYIFFAIIIFIAYWPNRDSPEPFEGLIQGSSYNGITSYLIVLQITLSIFSYLKHGTFPIGSAVYTLFIAVVGVGRGSIYSAIMILILSVIFNAFMHVKYLQGRKLFASALVFCFLFYYLFVNFDLIYNYLDSGTKALQGPKDSARVEILNEYIENLNWVNIFTGQDFSGTLIKDRYDGNPHIAFIRAHAYMGLLVVPILLSPMLFFFTKARSRDQLFVFSFSLIFLFRALSEPILFPTLLDFCYFLPFFALTATGRLNYLKKP